MIMQRPPLCVRRRGFRYYKKTRNKYIRQQWRIYKKDVTKFRCGWW